MVNFSAAVKDALQKRNIGVQELADEIGLSAAYIYGLLSDKKRWNQDIIAKVSSVLEIKIKYEVS
jgi:ribosome-binding protein aMBF1 (putative translation factor)